MVEKRKDSLCKWKCENSTLENKYAEVPSPHRMGRNGKPNYGWPQAGGGEPRTRTRIDADNFPAHTRRCLKNKIQTTIII
jgi:hypothetical protein